MYSSSCCSCSFEPRIIKNNQSSHKMYRNNRLNFQESTTILNACTEKILETYWINHVYLTFKKMEIYIYIYMLCFDLLTRPKMPFKVMHRKGVTHSNGSYERKSRGRKLADEMGRARKIPMVHYRVMHRKRVTSELHESYFRLMTIKHSISKIEWASNDYIIELSSTSQCSCQESLRQLETRCGRESPREPRWSGPQRQENKKDTTWRS